jgi:hypothetical protein
MRSWRTWRLKRRKLVRETYFKLSAGGLQNSIHDGGYLASLRIRAADLEKTSVAARI